MYENIIEKHFSYLSGLKLTDLSRTHFQLLINNAAEYPRTCQQIKITFCQVIKSAISDKLLPADSLEAICRDIDMPKYTPAEKRGLTPLEKEAIKTADFTDREKAFVYIAYGCGLRRGEILALTVFDISLERAELTANKSLAFEGNNIPKGNKDRKWGACRPCAAISSWLSCALYKVLAWDKSILYKNRRTNDSVRIQENVGFYTKKTECRRREHRI